MLKAIEDFSQFISDSPTPYHAVNQIGNRLAASGFIPLSVLEPWELEEGKSYFTQKNGSLIAFKLPQKKPSKALITASHTDSPAFKIKPQGLERRDGMSFLSTEVYGAPIIDSWLNRDLAIAGRVFGKNSEDEIEEHLFFFDEAPLSIPNIAYHIADKEHKRDRQKELQALFALNENATLESWIKQAHVFENLLSFDLFLISNEAPSYLGEHGELFAAPRLDNLSSAYASLVGFLNAKTKKETLEMALFFNHEEIGSSSYSGAQSPLFLSCFERIMEHYKSTTQETLCLKENSFCLSLDVGHAYLPGFEERYDPDHRCILGKGAAIKEHAAQKYATDALGVAKVVSLAQRHNLPWQRFVSHSDVASGSTIGPIFASQTGIPCIDIGIPILSMHSIREIMATSDLISLCHLIKHYYEYENT